MALAYDILTATATTLMVGNELAVAAFAHPQISRLPNHSHAQAAVSLARVLGRIMPFWYAIGLLLILGATYEYRPVFSGPGLLLLAAAILWALSIVFTVAMLVPINNRIAAMNPHGLTPHGLKTALDGIASIRSPWYCFS